MKSKKQVKRGAIGAILASTIALAVLSSPFQASAIPLNKEYDNLISMEGYNSYALKADGSAFYATGTNTWGRLAAGLTTNERNTPVQAIGFDIKMIDAGMGHRWYLKNDGTVWGWGYAAYGELATGDKVSGVKEPAQTVFINDVKEVRGGNDISIFLKNDGTVWTVGSNSEGALGIGDTELKYSVIPVQIPGLTDVVAIDAGNKMGAALKSDGTVWVWGNGLYGIAGNGTQTDLYSPVQFPITDIKAFSMGYDRLYVVTNAGELYGVGLNTMGKLGDGTTTTRRVPTKININDVKDIDAGDSTVTLLKEDGTVWSWGQNPYGQVGNGTTVQQRTPVQVLDTNLQPLNNVLAIDSGEYSSMALKADGTVWSWGWNSNGELGIGNTTHQKFATLTNFPNLLF